MAGLGGDGGGLASFDPETEKFTNYTFNPVDSTKVNYIYSAIVFEDMSANIWFFLVSNEGPQLCKIDPKTKQVSRYPDKILTDQLRQG